MSRGTGPGGVPGGWGSQEAQDSSLSSPRHGHTAVLPSLQTQLLFPCEPDFPVERPSRYLTWRKERPKETGLLIAGPSASGELICWLRCSVGRGRTRQRARGQVSGTVSLISREGHRQYGSPQVTERVRIFDMEFAGGREEARPGLPKAGSFNLRPEEDLSTLQS